MKQWKNNRIDFRIKRYSFQYVYTIHGTPVFVADILYFYAVVLCKIG